MLYVRFIIPFHGTAISLIEFQYIEITNMN